MAQQILLGPQTPEPNIRQAVKAMDVEGPIVVISAGWRDSEGDIAELQDHLGRPLEDLMIYHRAEEVFTREPGLRALKSERQEKLRELQRLYRIRLASTVNAARKLLSAKADPELLLMEQRAAISQLRALDRHHLHRIKAILHDYENRRVQMQIAGAPYQAVQERLAKAGLVLIAGGHVAVLLNRLRMFCLGDLLKQKPVIAWSAGAMALSDRIVLFHHNAPQGKMDAEVLDVGLGVVPKRVLLPGAKQRLSWNQHNRLALFSRRFAPAACNTLDNGSMVHLRDGQQVAVKNTYVITRSGRKKALKT